MTRPVPMRAHVVEGPKCRAHVPEGGAMNSPARVIIVEDESITALALARQLRRLGYEVVALASSGPQAIE
jgi:hypothetical protein